MHLLQQQFNNDDDDDDDDVISIKISKLTQHVGRKKRTAKRLCVPNVAGLLLVRFFSIFT